MDFFETMAETLNKGIETFCTALENFSSADKKRDQIILDLTQNLNECMKSNVDLLGEVKRLQVLDNCKY